MPSQQMAACFSHIWHLSITQLALLLCLSSPLLVLADVPWHTNLTAYQNGELGIRPRQHFYSAPLVKAPIYQVNHFDYDKTDKLPYIFLTGRYAEKGGQGPSIISAKDLSLIWAEEKHGVTQAAQPAMMKGQVVLAAYSNMMIRVWNQHYRQIYNVPAQIDPMELREDNHECFVTNQDTVVLIYCKHLPADLSPMGGPAEGDCVRDCSFQEIDPVTRKVIFDWNTYSHFTVNDTIWPYKGEGVYYMGPECHDNSHMNSVEKTKWGDYLVSHRHFHSVVLIDGKTGEVKWQMGGKRNQFKDITVNGTAIFQYQHQPRLVAHNRITLFDNSQLGNGFCTEEHKKTRPCSRGLEIEFDTEKMTMKVVHEYYHPQGIISASRGGMQKLPGGNVLIAWGQNGMYTEFTEDGEIVMDIQRTPVLPSDHGHGPIIAYRAYKGWWEGKPHWGPNISANANPESNGEKRIYVSWNGATAVAHWVLLLSQDKTDLNGPDKVAAQRERAGFETEFYIPWDNVTYARVAALDDKGYIIGSTPAVHIETGTLYPLQYKVTKIKKINSDNKASPQLTIEAPSHAKSKPQFDNSHAPHKHSFYPTVELFSAFFWFTAMISIMFVLIIAYLIRIRRVPIVYKHLAYLLKREGN